MGGFNTKLQGQCNSSLMIGNVDVAGGGGKLTPINCSAVGRFRGMWIFGILCLIYFISSIVYGILYGDRKDYDSGVIFYLVYNGIAALLCIYLIYTGSTGYTYTFHKPKRDDNYKIIKKSTFSNPISWIFPTTDYGNIASPGYDYRSDAPFIGWFNLIKSKDETKGVILNFKQLMLELGCSTDLQASDCKLFDVTNEKSINKLKQVITPGNKLVIDDYTKWKKSYDMYNKNKPKNKKIQYVFKKKGTSGIKEIDPKWNNTINNLKCKHKVSKSLCESTFDKDNCVWVEAKTRNGGKTKQSYCKKKWEWFTGANIMACDECDRMSPYCTLKYTSMIGFFGFFTVTLFIFMGLIQLETGFSESENAEDVEKTLNNINISIGWSIWSVMTFVTYIYFMLWFTCPTGSDLGNEGVDDVGYIDHFRMGWKLMKFPFIKNEGDNTPTYGIIIICLILFILLLIAVLVPVLTL